MATGLVGFRTFFAASYGHVTEMCGRALVLQSCLCPSCSPREGGWSEHVRVVSLLRPLGKGPPPRGEEAPWSGPPLEQSHSSSRVPSGSRFHLGDAVVSLSPRQIHVLKP